MSFKLKKIVLFALLSANVSAAAGTDHLYVGGNLLVGHNTELDAGFASIDESNDLGAGVFGGYSFAVHPNVDLGVELEYQHFGEAEFAENVSVEGNAFYINARPKFMEKGNNLYSAFILGVGTLQGETNILGASESDSKFSYQAGLEVGYMFNDIDVSVGYRYRAAEFDGVDLEIQGVTVGMRYNF
ncbi:porin family protein [Vibrio parahaemolyticus]|nr:porin family protein [Vibrio parahaemolyticus]EIV8636935.1 porin family protein [Vibrio parahaemolyticus]EIZ1450637.1 porin family protein [Vibrio parahaemolyticus]EJF4460510.1 porin family protein [Vibrio parahaemolyticus]EKL0056879.1 porin family protein [Vibrio parahaemolyticus]